MGSETLDVIITREAGLTPREPSILLVMMSMAHIML